MSHDGGGRGRRRHHPAHLPGLGDGRRLSARRRRAGADRRAVRHGPDRRRGGDGARRVCRDLRGVRPAHRAAPRHQPRDDRRRTADARGLAPHDPLGRARPHEARLLLDPPRPRAPAGCSSNSAPAAPGCSLDSRIDGFDQVVRRAAEAAAARGIALNEATVANLEALGDPPAGARSGSDERSAAGRRSARPVRHPGRLHRGGPRRQLPHARRLDRGAGRRIRLGQIGRQPEHPAHPAAQRRDQPRRDPVRRPARLGRAGRPRQAAGRRSGDAGDPRRPDLDHLSGADELAVAAAHDRRPGRRGAAAASQRRRRRGQGADRRDAAPGRVSRSASGPGAAIRSNCRAGCGSAR